MDRDDIRLVEKIPRSFCFKNSSSLAHYFAVAVMNRENALREQRKRTAPKVANRSAAPR
jgi:hypothetical protein